MRRQRVLLFFLGLLMIGTVACGSGSGGADQAATVAALSASIAQTATAGAVVVEPTATSEVPAPATAVLAAQATATGRSLAAEATQLVRATEDASAAAATAEAKAPILAELPAYGVDPHQGELAWIHPPVTIQTEGYMQYAYANQFIATAARDFVVAADITWNTRFGTTGCGFVVRSDGNEESINQYLVIATRGGNGRVLFVTQRNGQVIDNESKDIYANGIDPLFEWQNDTTNRVVVVGRGEVFTIYTNGTKIGEVTAQAGYDRGFVAFVALNESGDTTCQYDNVWLWLLN